MSDPRYPAPEPGMTRLSQSMIERHLRCSLREELRKANPVRRTTVKMAVGSATAAAAKQDCIQKRSLSDLVEIAVTAYEEEIGLCELWESRLEIGRGKDDSAAATRCYGTEVSSQITDVVQTEDIIIARIGADMELAGRPDVITAMGIGDLKTGQPWTQRRTDASRQLSAYSILYKARFGGYPRRVWIDSLSHIRNEWHAERLWSYRSADDCRAYWEIMRRVKASIESGIALPAPEGAWWCSKAHCEFWPVCPAVSRRR